MFSKIWSTDGMSFSGGGGRPGVSVLCIRHERGGGMGAKTSRDPAPEGGLGFWMGVSGLSKGRG